MRKKRKKNLIGTKKITRTEIDFDKIMKKEDKYFY